MLFARGWFHGLVLCFLCGSCTAEQSEESRMFGRRLRGQAAITESPNTLHLTAFDPMVNASSDRIFSKEDFLVDMYSPMPRADLPVSTMSSPRRMMSIPTPYTAAATIPQMPDADSTEATAAAASYNCPQNAAGLQTFMGNVGENIELSSGSYLLDTSVVIGTLTIRSGAELIFADVPGLQLSATGILVEGALRLGSATCPLASEGIAIELMGDGDRLSQSSEPLDQKALTAAAGGIVEIFGKRFFPTWARLTTTAAAGTTTVSLDSMVDWTPGQEVAVLTSDFTDLPGSHQNEVRTIVAASGTEVTLDAPLAHEHFAGLEYATEVVMLSRTVTIRGDAASETHSYGGQTRCLPGSQCRFGSVAAINMGQENIMGRYPFHFHLMGDLAGENNYIEDCVVRHSYFRGYTIHGTSSVRLSRNIAYDVRGSVYYLEDGVEENNLMEFNMAAYIQLITPLSDSEYNSGGQTGPEISSQSNRIQPTDATATGFYCTNGNNRWIGNAVSGGFTSYHFPSVEKALGDSYPFYPSSYSPESFEVLEFDGNTGHSNGAYWRMAAGVYVGGRLWEDTPGQHNYRYTVGRTANREAGETVIRNTKVWACRLGALFWGSNTGDFGFMLENFEAHDVFKSTNQLGTTVMYKAVITAHTGNSATSLPEWTQGFQLYDTDMQTILSEVTFRNFDRPGDRCIEDLVGSNTYKSQGIYSQRAISFENTLYANRFHHGHWVACYTFNADSCSNNCQNCPTTTGSSQVANMMDVDGSAVGWNLGGAILGSDDEDWETNGWTNAWWQLDDQCVRNTEWGFWACPDNGQRSVITLNLYEGVRSGYTPRLSYDAIVGKLYQFGHPDRHLQVGLATSPWVTGVCCDIGWYLDVEGGAPRDLTIYLDQMPPDDGLIFASPYPPSASITVERCIPDKEGDYPSCIATSLAGSLDEVRASDGKKHFIDSNGVVYLKLTLPWAGYFEMAGVKQLRRGYRWYYGIGSRYLIRSNLAASKTPVQWALPPALGSMGGVSPLPTTFTTTSVDMSCPTRYNNCLYKRCCQGLGVGCYQNAGGSAYCAHECVPDENGQGCTLLNPEAFPDNSSTFPTSGTEPTSATTFSVITVPPTSTIVAGPGGCGPAPNQNQPECNGRSYEECLRMMQQEGKCSWTPEATTTTTAVATTATTTATTAATTATTTATTTTTATAATTTTTTITTGFTTAATTTPLATTPMPLTCDALCGLTNNTYEGQGCAQWAEQQSCEGSYISVGDVSLRCAWITCDGVCYPEGVHMLSGCECAPLSTTGTTTVTQLTTTAVATTPAPTTTSPTPAPTTAAPTPAPATTVFPTPTLTTETTGEPTTITTTSVQLTCDTLCSWMNMSRDSKDCAFWSSDEAACESSYISVGDASIPCSWIPCDGHCFADGSVVLMDCDCSATTTTVTAVVTTAPTVAPTLAPTTEVPSTTPPSPPPTTPVSTTGATPPSTTDIPSTCEGLCNLVNNTHAGYGCGQWAQQQQACESSYISMGDVSVRCAWIDCGGECYADGAAIISGCDCQTTTPPSTTAPTIPVTSTHQPTTLTTTLVQPACGTLCNRMNISHDGQDCEFLSDAGACESSYISIGGASVPCSWIPCDGRCFADGSLVVVGCDCDADHTSAPTSATTTTTTTTVTSTASAPVSPTEAPTTTASPSTTPIPFTCGDLCSSTNSTDSGCEAWNGNEVTCTSSYVTVGSFSMKCAYLACSGECYAQGMQALQCPVCSVTTTTTTANSAGRCGPAPNQNQPECNGLDHEACLQRIEQEGKCSWTGLTTTATSTLVTTTPTLASTTAEETTPTTAATVGPTTAPTTATTVSPTPAPSTAATVSPTTPPTTGAPTPAPTTEASTTSSGLAWDDRVMQMTHYWDCNGQACDATTLQPFDEAKYVSPPGYGPQDPRNFSGGSVYGEKMWLTGAASDALSELLGPDDGCCGAEDTGIGGCGKCLLVQNPDSLHPDWTAVVMKKNRCPPWTNGCGAGVPHFDIAAPGFDNLEFSTANICGAPGTGFMNQQQSTALGCWWRHGCSNTAECDFLCAALPEEFQEGCRLFASWGWMSGDPSSVKFTAVECPAAFTNHVSGLFDASGVVSR